MISQLNLKMCKRMNSAPICDAYNNSLSDQIFPEILKKADITPIHRKDETTNKENYRRQHLTRCL